MGRLPLLLALVLLAPGLAAGSARAGTREVVFVEEPRLYETEGSLRAGETRTFRFQVVEPNVTRVEFRLAWSGSATLSLSAHEPSGREAAPPALSDSGALRLSSGPLAEVPAPAPPEQAHERGSFEGRGEWRVVLRVEESADDAHLPFELHVLVTRYEPVTVRPVTLHAPGKLLAPSLPLVLGLAALACAGAAALARRTPDAKPLEGDNTPSSAPEQDTCAPRE